MRRPAGEKRRPNQVPDEVKAWVSEHPERIPLAENQEWYEADDIVESNPPFVTYIPVAVSAQGVSRSIGQPSPLMRSVDGIAYRVDVAGKPEYYVARDEESGAIIWRRIIER